MVLVVINFDNYKPEVTIEKKLTTEHELMMMKT